MGANVFANGREISAKKAGNRISGAMPDPCLSPPSPPAGPVPIPYPNFSDDSRTDNGTKTVLIDGDQVGRKSDSSYKDCKGDEAATRNFGMGTISHTIQGEMKFISWSFDVKFEDSNVPRHMDFMTGNHGSPQTDGSTAPVIGMQLPAGISPEDCETLGNKNEKEREKVIEELEDKSSLNKEEQKTLDKAQGTGMTISSVKSQVPGAEGTFSASSSGCAQACNRSGLVSGGCKEQKMGLNKKIRDDDDPKYDEAKEKAGVLCDKSHVNPGGGAGAHAEAKIANHMSKEFPSSPMRGGSMLFNIDWRFKRKQGPMQSNMPCTHCHKMMCHAMNKEEGCDIQIFICDKDGNPQELTEDDCNSEDGYSKLSTRVDGNPKPGRPL